MCACEGEFEAPAVIVYNISRMDIILGTHNTFLHTIVPIHEELY